MANEEQLSILKQGVEVWNKWQDENGDVEIDLRRANLSGVDLSHAYLEGADFRAADLRSINLSNAYLDGANFSQGANLSVANLSVANLVRADLSGANLTNAVLTGANLSEAKLHGANLRGSDFSVIYASGTVFGDLDLRQVKGLDDVDHVAPSTIGTDTFAKSKGKIPEAFLRCCGLSDWEIEETKLYSPDLSNEEVNKILYRMYDLRATQAIQISPLFISYSQVDGLFVDKLESRLNKNGIRFWRDIHSMKAGKMEKQIDIAIRQNPTVLLVLSEHSLSSDWVEHEVRTARGLEKEMERDVLCPVALDDSWKSSRWPERVMEQIMEYNILDFSQWKDDVKFEGMFRKLIDGLELFYKG